MAMNKKLLLIITAAVLVTGGTFVASRYRQNQTVKSNSGAGPAQIDDDQAVPDQADRPGAVSSGNDQSLKPNITIAEQERDSGNIVVRAIVGGVTEGTCYLTLEKPDNKKVEREAKLAVGPSYYICDGFTVSRSDLQSTGEWSAKVRMVSGIYSGTSEVKKFNVE